MKSVRPVTTSFSVRSLLLAPAVAEQLIGLIRSLIGPRPVTSVELVSSRSYVQLGSHLYAWTLLDILGLLLCFYGLTYDVDHEIIMLPLFKSRLAPYETTKQLLAKFISHYVDQHQNPK